MRWNKILWIFLFCTITFRGVSQVHSFKNFGLDKSEFPSRIECLNQGVNGELYIGTLAGLVVYDGQKFVQITEREGIAENAISSIGIYREIIWIGHWAGSLTRYNSENGSLDVIDLKEALNFSSIINIVPLSRSSAILVSKEGKVYLHSESGIEQILIATSTANEKVHSIVSDSTVYFAVTNHGIYQTDESGSFAVWESLFHSDMVITCATLLGTNEWAIGTEAGGFLLNIESDQLTSIGEALEIGKVVSILQDQEEYLWLGSAEKGVIKYHPITKDLELIKRDNGLSYNQIRGVFMDREGIVWIATVAGLDQYLGRSFTLFDRRSGILENLIWDFAMVNDKILLATSQGLNLIEIIDEGKRVKTHSKFSLNNEEPRKILLKHQGELVFVITAERNVWYGSIGEGFQRISQLDGVALTVEEVNGEIWVGTTNGVMKVENGQLKEQYTKDTGLGGNKVNGIYYSKVKNETWITVLGGPCTLYKDGRFKKFGSDEGLTSSVIQDASFDKQGNPWFATYDDGVIYYEDGRFKNLSEKVAISSTTTFAIEIDEDESVWIGHNWGLDVYRIPFEDIKKFGKDQGFMGMEVNTGAIHGDGDNNIMMGTLMGLLRFKPANYRTNIIEPITRIKTMRIGDVTVDLNVKNAEIDFGVNDLHIEFSGISLVNPSENMYEYRLLGAHESWKVKYDQSPIEYLSLPPGSFTFELRTCNSSGFCNKTPISYSFTIKPPFYRTWWFYTLVFLVVVLAIFLMDRFRVLALMDEKNMLSEKLANYEQQLIEKSQVADELLSQKAYDSSIFNQLTVGSEKSTLHHRTLPLDTYSADQMVELDFDNFKLYGFVDLGISGLTAKFLMEKIKYELLNELKPSERGDSKSVIKVFGEQIEKHIKTLEKHKEPNWVLIAHENNELTVHNRLCSFFVLDGNQVVEFKACLDRMSFKFEVLDASSRIFIASDGLVEQLSEDGMKTYGKRRLHAKLSDSVALDAEAIFDVVSNDLRNWQGAMEQSDDIMLIILEL